MYLDLQDIRATHFRMCRKFGMLRRNLDLYKKLQFFIVLDMQYSKVHRFIKFFEWFRVFLRKINGKIKFKLFIEKQVPVLVWCVVLL